MLNFTNDHFNNVPDQYPPPIIIYAIQNKNKHSLLPPQTLLPRDVFYFSKTTLNTYDSKKFE